MFTITITDFGNAVVIGGNFPVLATEIYNQVSGQMKFGMGAVVGIMLLAPAALSIWIEHVTTKRQARMSGESGQPPYPHHHLPRDLGFTVACGTIALSIYAVVLTVVAVSFVRLWPYKFEFTLKHYNITLSDGYSPLWNSVYVSLMAALFGTSMLFMLAFAVRKFPGRLANLASLLSALPVGVPGLVLGLGLCVHVQQRQQPHECAVWLRRAAGAVQLLPLPHARLRGHDDRHAQCAHQPGRRHHRAGRWHRPHPA